MRSFFLTIYIFFIIASNLIASNDYSIEQITPSKDFPVSEISKVFFGNKGLLWIGTNRGLYYYDGYTLNSQLSEFFDKSTLADDYVLQTNP